MIFTVCECLGRGNNNTFTCMYSQRIKILHVTNSDTVIIFVPDNFIFNLFPSFK